MNNSSSLNSVQCKALLTLGNIFRVIKMIKLFKNHEIKQFYKNCHSRLYNNVTVKENTSKKKKKKKKKKKNKIFKF